MISTARDAKKTLHFILRKLADGQYGSRILGGLLKSPDNKRFFLADSLRRARLRGQLEEALRLEGVSDPRTGGTFVGWLHRATLIIGGALGMSDRALLKIAERGESRAILAYQQAIDRRLPSHLHQLLLEQAPSMRRAHDYMRATRMGVVDYRSVGKRKPSRDRC
jgi:uncharacterized protein (TIGR02284 family)